MAELAIVSFKVEQSEAQAKLKTVRLEYGYTLTPSAEECRRGTTFAVAVAILGDDLLGAKTLVSGVDEHSVECTAGTAPRPIASRRDFIAAQELLDEDIGTDEIKVRVTATPDQGDAVSADTPVVRGNF